MEHGKFKSLLDELYKDLDKELKQERLPIKDFQEELRKLIEHACQIAYDKGKSDKRNIEGNIIDFLFQTNHAFTKRRSDLMTAYSRMYHLTTKLIDTEKRLSKFDLKERLRFFMFRVLTAIGIAAVVLGTAIVAHNLGIPLPLSGLKNVNS